MMSDNSSPLSLLTVLKPGDSFHIDAKPKPSKTIDQMIEIMAGRGLEITDEQLLRRFLYDCNYYRLSGYSRVFQNNPAHGDNTFKKGTKDIDFLTPYKRDEVLRTIILRGTAPIELTLRSRFAYLLANNGGAYTYLDPDTYVDKRDKQGRLLRDGLLQNMKKWIRVSNEVCINHYKRKNQPIPVWAAIETFPFDTVSRMISLHTDTESLRELYRGVGLRSKLRVSSEVVHAMVFLRNLCSHHSRLWHREMVIPSPMTRDMKNAFPDFEQHEKSVATTLIALMYLMSHIEESARYSDEIISFLSEDSAYRNGIINPLHWE